MSDLYERQLLLEETYSTEGIIASQKQVLDAYAQGRASDMGSGRILVAKAFEAAKEPYIARINAKDRGLGGKYLKLLREIDVDVAIIIGLRTIITNCANPEEKCMQDVLSQVGRTLETECMLSSIMAAAPVYGKRTIQYLDSAGTKSVSHRYRTLLAGARNIGLGWEVWSKEERTGTARILLASLYDSTGLFKWVQARSDIYIIKPEAALEKYLIDAVESAQANIRLPAMLIPPTKWTSQFEGGYLTDWCRAYAPMCGLKAHTPEQRKWVYKHLKSEGAAALRDAMNKAQETPYRVNTRVLEVLRQATAMRVGILGLPPTIAEPKPVFPFPEGWLRAEASQMELDQFAFWKTQMSDWYTQEAKRVGRKAGILSRIRELVRYQDEEAVYFPTFIDWRGRLYFRSSIHPQQNDAVKGCLEFAEGKRLGAKGLHWLKVHVANSCGYDKHSDVIKAKWCDDNWEMIQNFLNNPYDVAAPEPDTAFCLLQAGYALQEAYELDNPEDYICHVAVAMDATCSGLQHLSALTRDEIGGKYTNLLDNSEDQKSDIYKHVGSIADSTKNEYTQDVVIQDYWKDTPVSRQMSKKPVMTFVYGSTLISTIESVRLDMCSAGMDIIRDGDNTILYSLNALAIPIAKALRRGVEATVPRCATMMEYMQRITRRHKEQHFQWITPVGVPVVNWANGTIIKRVAIKSMGVDMITMSYNDGKYNIRRATNGIVPNFVHSLDSAHLMMCINEFSGRVLPIHDSFGTHPSDVPELHRVLRSTFVDLYSNYSIEKFLQENSINTEEHEVPSKGTLDITAVHNAPFMFC